MDKPVLLMTRPHAAAERFVTGLDPVLVEGVQICFSPLLEIVSLHTNLRLPLGAPVIFTSAHAIKFVEGGAGRGAFCVGVRTAEAAKARGWQIKMVAQDADDLIAQMEKEPITEPLLHLSGTHRRGEIETRLTALGMHTEVVEVYDQVLKPLSREAQEWIDGEAPVILPLFSPRTAAQFRRQVRAPQGLQVVAISAAVAREVESLPVQVLEIARAPDGASMRDAVENLLRKNSLP